MKKQKTKASAPPPGVEQPQPFTPSVTKAQVRQHAYELYRDKLAHGGLTLEDWILAEKDLVTVMQTGELARS
jgi:hypothetical protein